MRRLHPLALTALLVSLAASLATGEAPTYEQVERADVGPFAVSHEIDSRAYAFDVVIEADEALLEGQTGWSFGLDLEITNQSGDPGALWLFQLSEPWSGQGVPADATNLSTFSVAASAPGGAQDLSTEMGFQFLGDAIHMLLYLEGDTALVGAGEVSINAWSFDALPEDVTFTLAVTPGG